MTTLTILTTPQDGVPDRLRDLGDLEDVEVRVAASADELGDALPGTDVLLLWDYFSTALAGQFHRADDLAWVHVAAAGVDSLLFDDLVDSDVVVTNARGVFDRPIAEFVLGFLLLHAKSLAAVLADQRRRAWNRQSTSDLSGTRALVVGTGAIGREIARVLRALDVEVVGAGSHARGGDPDFGTIIGSDELAAHVSGFDWIIDIAPLTERTEGLFDASVFAAMDPHAFFVNVGRGATVDTAALVDALAAGSIAGAALDVVDVEPLPADHPLWECENVVISPHMSGDTHGWRQRLEDQFLELFALHRQGTPFPHTVDKKAGFVR
ncbi:D-2-hydroxyacid dehydrogenase [Brevibacterium casei]|uniref:D-2-hydroxyacid dehydrogenase n=1 Tax=Brevibacterium casei TaxID=33889 RepID=UPI0015D178AF|nr:D-2-hydroxyacid dehydrogenase [Brevibacterium casei]MCT1448410.1 D-2-hydroxyacid dehydrogenase [Brevibacterium casei]MCT2184251.1 D-2-hydroxyacid dehydrogenase [Brevibacterium casei]MDH5148604.1 D-2-hydroxyacid dehydrogenase [Brevibacterium casei]QZE24643.1 D-2-hydroxyacid dehydrogenase [Brevibacterium casei]